MRFGKTSFLAAILVAAAAVFAATAAADHGGGKGDDHGHGHRGHGHAHAQKTVLEQNLVGSILSDPPIHGVTRGGVPWEGTGTAELRKHGKFELRIRNLVIEGTDNPGPVTTITVSLYCAPDSSGAVFTTSPVPLSSHGNARVRQHVTVPQRCLAPVLLVHPNGSAAAYIAATGFTS
ncbi:MAG TPA: hypothetical protein VH297_01515 [Gaiellaceae bacterium]|jgi:hypothetical protein